MVRSFCHAFLGVAFSACVLAPNVSSQCLSWRAFPEREPDVSGVVNALGVHDDGSGPALFIGGSLRLADAPGVSIGVFRWDGASYTPIGPPGTVTALATFDDGSSPALYAAMMFPSRVMRWDGSTWSQIGATTNSTIFALAVHDDGTGPALYVGGSFVNIGTSQALGVARWNGTAWIGMPGLDSGFSAPIVRALASYDDGTGPALYAGGTFASTAGPAMGSPNIAKWSSSAWSGVGSGLPGDVTSMVTFDDGSGPSLFVAGSFGSPGVHIVRRDGSGWHAVGSGIAPIPGVAAVLDDGSGAKLYVSGLSPGTQFTNGPASVSRWDGASWSSFVPSPMATCRATTFGIQALAVFDEGTGPHVFAGGRVGSFGRVQAILARARNNAWERVGAPLEGLNGSVLALHVFDDGSGPALYAGGLFCRADDENAPSVARFDGSGWQTLGNGLELDEPVSAFAEFDPGTGPTLIAADFNLSNQMPGARISRWSGTSWISLGTTEHATDHYSALQQFGAYLYIGGEFDRPDSHLIGENLSRWSPSTGFVSASSAVGVGTNGAVNAFIVHDDGSGPALFAGGAFTTAIGVAANRIVRFDGINWTPLASGMDASVDALVSFDDGTGSALYAGGNFTTAGGVPAAHVARWNGSSWAPLGAGLDARVTTLHVFDDGSGAALYAGGSFIASGSASVKRIARWNGTTWSAVGGGTDGTVSALCAFDGGGVAQLFAGGDFHTAGTLQSDDIAAWRGCGSTTITRFCFGDGSDGVCPCGNFGLSGRGCNNSAATGGARLNATGTTSPDTIVLHAGGEMPNAPTLVFQGSSSLSQPILFGDGMRCVGGNLKRLFTTNAVGGAINVPDATQMSISARSAALGDPLVPGSVRSYQTWYRDPNLSFCGPPAGGAWNLSNAVRIVW